MARMADTNPMNKHSMSLTIGGTGKRLGAIATEVTRATETGFVTTDAVGRAVIGTKFSYITELSGPARIAVT